MGFFDRLKYLPARVGHEVLDAGKGFADHVGNVKERITIGLPQWCAERKREHQALKAERQAAKERIKQYNDYSARSMYRGMDPRQRQLEIGKIAADMPGVLKTAHARWWLRGLTAPLRLLWHKRTQSPEPEHKSNTWLLLLAIFYHLSFFVADPSLMTRFWWNIAMLLIVILLIFNKSERNGDTYRTLLLWIIVLEFAIPFLANLAIVHQFDFIRLYVANSFLLWTWIYYAVFIRGSDVRYGPTAWARALIVIFWLGVALSAVGTSLVDFNEVDLNTAGAEQWFAAHLVFSKAIEGWRALYDGVTSGVENIGDIWKTRIKQASGYEYYYGVVEENEKEQLGVYLEDLKPSQSIFEEGEPITVFALLKAYTLDDTITVDVGCYAGKEKSKLPGKIYPDERFEIYNLQEEELDCSFERLTAGTNRVTFTADFNFETIAYVKRYFADRDAILAATRLDINLLDQYQIVDQHPVAHYTNGPLSIGMGPEQALIGVSETYTVEPRIAVTLDSRWDGNIKKLKEVVLIIPDELTLDASTCTDKDWGDYTKDSCVADEQIYRGSVYQSCDGDDACIEDACASLLDNYHAYTLDVSGKPEYEDIESYITISCRMHVDNVAGLLGATPIATHYFYVKTRYDYAIEEDTAIKIEEIDDHLAGEDSGATKEEIPTLTSLSKEAAMQYIFHTYGDYLRDAQTTFGVPVCTQAALIVQISAGDPDYYDPITGQKGLMGIPDDIADDIADDAGLSTYRWSDPEASISLGNAYLKNIHDNTKDSFGAETIKVYYYGVYEKKVEEADDTDRAQFATQHENYVEVCKNLGFNTDDSVVVDEVNADGVLVIGESAYPPQDGTSQTVQTGITLHNDAFVLSINRYVTDSPSIGYLSDYVTANLMLGSTDIDFISEGHSGLWQSFSHYTLFTVLFDREKEIINYRYYNNFIKTINLEENEEEAVFENQGLYITYDADDISGGFFSGDITLMLANDPNDPAARTKICTVDWDSYTTYETCAGDDLPGFIIRNIDTDEDAQGTAFAHIQLDWSNERQMEGIQ